ncbi:MAG: TraI domain-containing protein [Coxiellaceae bacterium]|nr:TraI domain-containing protein [Coxiellaceae bacterium]
MFIKSTSGVASHSKLHTYEEGYLLPVLTKDELLFSQRHKGLLRLVRDLAEISDDDFNRSYGSVLQNFMEFTQVLPHKTSGILGSLLNYGLANGVAVFQKYCQLRKLQTNPLLKFAVFTAALLHDLGRVLTNQRIVLVDENGDFIRDWNPFLGSMVGQAKFFKMYPIAASYLRLEKEVTPLFARQLIPVDCFLWLSSDPVIFSDWIAALLGEEGVGAKEITFALALVKRDDIIAVLTTLDGANTDMTAPIATELGEEFYRWLKKGLESGEIPVNTDDANVHSVAEGVLLEKALFKKFVEQSNLNVNFLTVYHQMADLMGLKKAGADFLNAVYYSPSESSSNYSSFTNSVAARARLHREGMLVDAINVFIRNDVNSTSALRSTKAMRAAHYQSPEKMAGVAAALRAKNSNS